MDSHISTHANADARLADIRMTDAEPRTFLSDTTNPVLCTPAVAVTVGGAAAGAVYGEVVD